MDENLQAFNVSDNAARKISALLKDEQEADGKYMRVAVEGGGCSGFQYIFKFDSIKNSDDLIFKKNDVTDASGAQVTYEHTGALLCTGYHPCPGSGYTRVHTSRQKCW